VALLAALASCGTQRPTGGVDARTAGAPSGAAVGSPGITSTDPYLRTAEELRSRKVRVWFEIDLVAPWLDGPTTFRRAVQRVAELARFPGTVGFKVADELGYHDGLSSQVQVIAFLRATRAALTRVAPDAQVLVDAVVPELGCLSGLDAAGAACAREVRATSPGATVDTVSSYLAAGLVDRLDLSGGLLTASDYRDRGLTLLQADRRVWRRVDALGWSTRTGLQGRKALAMDGGWSGTDATASNAGKLYVDVPRQYGAHAVDIWAWRQAYDGGTYSLLATDLRPNPLWDVLLARKRAGAHLFTHVTPSTLSTGVLRRAHEYDLIASAFDDVFVAAGPI
jgi:hypothetical protein